MLESYKTLNVIFPFQIFGVHVYVCCIVCMCVMNHRRTYTAHDFSCVYTEGIFDMDLA